jgi:two-component system OmpR family response regulator
MVARVEKTEWLSRRASGHHGAQMGSAHILIVDNDRELRAVLHDYFQRSGFRTTAVSDGEGARRALHHAHFDLAVLDVMLPHETGLDICRTLRTTSDIPIIVLTAPGEEVDRIVGFEVGADDCLAKPFNPRELLCRIKAVLRRTSLAPRSVDALGANAFRFAGWRLDTMERTLRNASGLTIALGGAEFRLLSHLLANAPRLLTRVELMELVKGRELDPFDSSIAGRVSRLRQTLGDDARAPRIIKTVYGEGYVIGVLVEREP